MSKLAQLREERGLTLQALAEKVNISRQQLARWEAGTATPQVGKLRRLAAFYGVTVADLVQSSGSFRALTNRDRAEQIAHLMQSVNIRPEELQRKLSLDKETFLAVREGLVDTKRRRRAFEHVLNVLTIGSAAALDYANYRRDEDRRQRQEQRQILQRLAELPPPQREQMERLIDHVLDLHKTHPLTLETVEAFIQTLREKVLNARR